MKAPTRRTSRRPTDVPLDARAVARGWYGQAREELRRAREVLEELDDDDGSPLVQGCDLLGGQVPLSQQVALAGWLALALDSRRRAREALASLAAGA